MAQKVKLSTIAETLGVSTATVSLALGAPVPNDVHVTASVSSVPLTAVCR